MERIKEAIELGLEIQREYDNGLEFGDVRRVRLAGWPACYEQTSPARGRSSAAIRQGDCIIR